jgi:endonuclease-3
MSRRIGEPGSRSKIKGNTQDKAQRKDEDKKKVKTSPGESKWPRPEAPMTARTLSRFLVTVRAWKQGRAEPVVGRIMEEQADPFAVLVATVLSLRTRDAVTQAAFERLWPRASTPSHLMDLPLKDLEEAIRPVGFYKTKARALKAIAAQLLARHGGKVPDDLDALLALPGVGRKTANLVLTEGFGKEGICVDTHVHRILNWWGFVETKAPEETEMVLRETLPRPWWIPVNGLLVSFGQTTCKPVGPKCAECPLRPRCPYPGKK